MVSYYTPIAADAWPPEPDAVPRHGGQGPPAGDCSLTAPLTHRAASGRLAAGMRLSPHESSPRPRAHMTTTPTKRPESAGIAWGSLLWIAGLHAGALLAFLPAYFTWQALAVCLVLHWLTGGIGICMTYHRLLTHRSFATRPEVAGIRPDGHRLLRLRRGADRLGGRPPPAPRPLRRRARRPQPRTAASAGPTCSGG